MHARGGKLGHRKLKSAGRVLVRGVSGSQGDQEGGEVDERSTLSGVSVTSCHAKEKKGCVATRPSDGASDVAHTTYHIGVNREVGDEKQYSTEMDGNAVEDEDERRRGSRRIEDGKGQGLTNSGRRQYGASAKYNRAYHAGTLQTSSQEKSGVRVPFVLNDALPPILSPQLLSSLFPTHTHTHTHTHNTSSSLTSPHLTSDHNPLGDNLNQPQLPQVQSKIPHHNEYGRHVS
jgi:hypothetical protein